VKGEKTVDWFNNWIDKLHETFIEGDRYMTLLEGFGETLKITFGALLIGIVIGTFVAIVKVLCEGNKKLKIFDVLCNIYLTVIRGTPVVVQLLIMFFIVFVSAEDGTMVATLTFGINSGAYVAETIRSGILAIDKGQTEAGRSLGFSAGKTMWLIVLPQAFKNILPAIGNEMIALLKETSVAGYVAVVDLTKAGNQIRNTTYDQFNPIICVALVYLTVVLIMTRLLNMLERRLRKSER